MVNDVAVIKCFVWCSRFLYPGLVALTVASVSFPLGLGQYMAGDLNTHEQVSAISILRPQQKSDRLSSSPPPPCLPCAVMLCLPAYIPVLLQ